MRNVLQSRYCENTFPAATQNMQQKYIAKQHAETHIQYQAFRPHLKLFLAQILRFEFRQGRKADRFKLKNKNEKELNQFKTFAIL